MVIILLCELQIILSLQSITLLSLIKRDLFLISIKKCIFKHCISTLSSLYLSKHTMYIISRGSFILASLPICCALKFTKLKQSTCGSKVHIYSDQSTSKNVSFQNLIYHVQILHINNLLFLYQE